MKKDQCMRISAGILPYRRRHGKLELYLVHMGGPFWRNKKRAWSIVKGEVAEGESLLDAAIREFREETSHSVDGTFVSLGSHKSSGKEIHVWAVEADPPTEIRSNTFVLEWPPHSGEKVSFPEVDRAAWFAPEAAREVVVESQIPFIERLEEKLA